MADTATAPVPAAPPDAAAEASVAGQSYWQIVWRQFRKDKVSLVAGAIVILLFLSAILAPVIANDKPYYVTGTFPGAYRRQYLEWKAGAHPEFARLPREFETAQADWAALKVTLADLKKRLGVEDWREVGPVLDATRDEFVAANPNDFKWKNDQVTLAEVRRVLGPEKWAPVERTVQRVAAELEGQFRARLAGALRGIRTKLDALAEQLPPPQAGVARTLADNYEAIHDGGRFLALRGPAYAAAEERLKTLRDQAAAQLDPKSVTLVPATYYPLLRNLRPLDLLFLTLLLGLVTWCPILGVALRRRPGIRPVRRLELLAIAALAPAGLAALAWSFRPEHLESVDFKKGFANGDVVATALWMPPVPFGMNEDHLDDKFKRPGTVPAEVGGTPAPKDGEATGVKLARGRYLLGTDENGRDLLTRLLWGGRISLSVGFVAVAIYTVIGLVLGSLAGYFRGWVDIVVSRIIIEWMMCFPTFFLILAAVAVLPPSIYNVMLVIGLTGWTTEARLVRGEFLRLGGQDFVLAARALGVPAWRIIAVHVVPNAVAPLLVAASLGVAGAILTESALSFLGLGVPIPDASWGSILSTARENLSYWWLIFFPGFLIFLTVTVYNLVGEGLRDATDPRMKI